MASGEVAKDWRSGTVITVGNKALLIDFGDLNIKWIPESCIHSEYVRKSKEHFGEPQEFLIESWLLIRNKIGEWN